MVGIPLNSEYKLVTASIQARYRQQIGLQDYDQVLLVTGGGNGAEQLNHAVVANTVALLKQYPHLAIVHFAGRSHEEAVSKEYDDLLLSADRQRVVVLGFVADFYKYIGAADIIIARGGATNLAEFAVQAKACIIIPAAQLVGDHQTKNAQALAEAQAIVMLTQEQAEQDRRLAHTVADLLQDAQKTDRLRNNLARFAHPDAAERLAMLLLEQAKT